MELVLFIYIWKFILEQNKMGEIFQHNLFYLKLFTNEISINQMDFKKKKNNNNKNSPLQTNSIYR